MDFFHWRNGLFPATFGCFSTVAPCPRLTDLFASLLLCITVVTLMESSLCSFSFPLRWIKKQPSFHCVIMGLWWSPWWAPQGCWLARAGVESPRAAQKSSCDVKRAYSSRTYTEFGSDSAAVPNPFPEHLSPSPSSLLLHRSSPIPAYGPVASSSSSEIKPSFVDVRRWLDWLGFASQTIESHFWTWPTSPYVFQRQDTATSSPLCIPTLRSRMGEMEHQLCNPSSLCSLLCGMCCVPRVEGRGRVSLTRAECPSCSQAPPGASSSVAKKVIFFRVGFSG